MEKVSSCMDDSGKSAAQKKHAETVQHHGLVPPPPTWSDSQLYHQRMINVQKFNRRATTNSIPEEDDNDKRGNKHQKNRTHSAAADKSVVRSWSSDDLESVSRNVSTSSVYGTMFGPDVIRAAAESDMETHDEDIDEEASRIKKLWRRIIRIGTSNLGLLVTLLVYSFIGAAIFQAIEAPYEELLKANITMLRKTLINTTLHLSKHVNHTNFNQTKNFTVELEERLKSYEDQLYTAFQHGIQAGRDQKIWDYWGALFFSATVYTTVGYGHIAPSTDWGRIATMLYATIGVPLFFVVMSNLGRLLTRLIKYLWSYIRMIYYTQECRKIRKAKTIRRIKERVSGKRRHTSSQSKSSRKKSSAEMSDADSYVDYEVDDQFNLHPLVAITITVLYIFAGALMYVQWEPWTYLEAFYFIFVSISTIGLGDLVPDKPKYFLASFAYIILGLSLVAMVINVIMEFFNNTFSKAKRKVEEMSRSIDHHSGLGRKFPSSKSKSSGDNNNTDSREQHAQGSMTDGDDPFSEVLENDFDFAQHVNRAFSLNEDDYDDVDIVLEITMVDDDEEEDGVGISTSGNNDKSKIQGITDSSSSDGKETVLRENGHVVRETSVP